jgi:hypothetical protein
MAYMTDENGNYKRTVTCGHCYDKGHNKGSCEKRKVDLAERVKVYEKELTNPDLEGWRRTNAERYLERSKSDLNKMLTKGQNRKCGYCSETGHTRRTCPERKSEVSRITDETIDFRNRVAERLVNEGFGPGALVKVRHRHGEEPRLAVVTHINFMELTTRCKVSPNDYFNGHNGVGYQYLVPFEDTWGGSYTNGECYLPVNYTNVDNIPVSEWYRNPSNNAAELLSGVDISEDSLLTEEAIDRKHVSKWVANNIVDPR